MGKWLAGIAAAVISGVLIFYLTEVPPGGGNPKIIPTLPIDPPVQSIWPFSPNGQYRAMKVGEGKSIHYQIEEVKTNRVLLVTQSQYGNSNDVKAGVFSPDSREFAAAYHYGHDGKYTWIGIWNIQTGQLLRVEKQKGYSRNISWVF